MAVSVSDIDALLPQTQCTRCGYDACRPYAEAIANGEAPINRCPPGGQAGIERLARLLETQPMALDAECGEERDIEVVAKVIEEDCIGCTKCIQACPVDAIVGAMNLMHTVIADECNGCELCIPPCPVDCIELVESPSHPPAFERSSHYRTRFGPRNARPETSDWLEFRASSARAAATGRWKVIRLPQPWLVPPGDGTRTRERCQTA